MKAVVVHDVATVINLWVVNGVRSIVVDTEAFMGEVLESGASRSEK